MQLSSYASLNKMATGIQTKLKDGQQRAVKLATVGTPEWLHVDTVRADYDRILARQAPQPSTALYCVSPSLTALPVLQHADEVCWSWKINEELNAAHALCSTYPASLCTPVSLDQQLLANAAAYRSKRRSVGQC